MSKGNRKYWDQMAKPPASALKTIKGGRLKGMTDISPQWRLEAMTEVFGPVGVGWKYSIDKLWAEPTGDEMMAFALVSVQVKDGDGCWGEPIPGIGGNKLVSVERGGVHNNDEAYKMAVTDALSVALKALGVGADIYAGLWDGSKYHHRPEFMITKALLDALKVKYSKAHADELEQLDKQEKMRCFAHWCRGEIGEDVDYLQWESWSREWYEQCIEALNGQESEDAQIDLDVPFEA